MSTPLSQLLALSHANDGALALEVPVDWLQGRSIYGGLQTALALQAMRSLVPDMPVRSLQTNFIAPLSGSVRAEANVLRTGKNTVQAEAKLYDEQGLTTQVLGVFGTARPSKVSVSMDSERAPEAAPIVFPYIPGLTPQFTKHFGMRLLEGHPPFSGIETTKSIYELDLRDDGPVTEFHVVAFADVVPPLGMSVLTTPTFGSTLSWMLEFLADVPDDSPLEDWRLHTKLVAAADGYSNQSSTLRSPSGQAIALSRQCMLVFG